MILAFCSVATVFGGSTETQPQRIDRIHVAGEERPAVAGGNIKSLLEARSDDSTTQVRLLQSKETAHNMSDSLDAR